METFAEVEGVDAPADVARAEGWQLEEVDIDAPAMPAGLDELRAKRVAQRTLPGFGAFADDESCICVPSGTRTIRQHT